MVSTFNLPYISGSKMFWLRVSAIPLLPISKRAGEGEECAEVKDQNLLDGNDGNLICLARCSFGTCDLCNQQVFKTPEIFVPQTPLIFRYLDGLDYIVVKIPLVSRLTMISRNTGVSHMM